MQVIKDILRSITCDVMGTTVQINVHVDKTYGSRLYLQASYVAPCTKTGGSEPWFGRKWYLSSHMTRDEVVKTAFAAFKAAVEHEVMEGFKFNGKIVFNPHVSFEALLSITDQEVSRHIVEKR